MATSNPSGLGTGDSGLGTGHSALLLGGTFDPPHIGHLVLAECARAQFGVDVATFLPAGDPWRKTGSAGMLEPLTSRQVTPASIRLEMVRLAVEGNPRLRVDDREIRRPGPSYTVDTLAELRNEGYTSIILVLGADALADMENWKEPARIRELATLAVAPKGGPKPQLPAGAIEVEMPLIGVSSTDIRARVASGRPVRYLVPPPVEEFITRHGLYR